MLSRLIRSSLLFRSSGRRFSQDAASEYLPLVFVRHGQSTWNQKNIFIGMTDTPLTEDGILEARVAGRLLAGEGEWNSAVSCMLINFITVNFSLSRPAI